MFQSGLERVDIRGSFLKRFRDDTVSGCGRITKVTCSKWYGYSPRGAGIRSRMKARWRRYPENRSRGVDNDLFRKCCQRPVRPIITSIHHSDQRHLNLYKLNHQLKPELRIGTSFVHWATSRNNQFNSFRNLLLIDHYQYLSPSGDALTLPLSKMDHVEPPTQPDPLHPLALLTRFSNSSILPIDSIFWPITLSPIDRARALSKLKVSEPPHNIKKRRMKQKTLSCFRNRSIPSKLSMIGLAMSHPWWTPIQNLITSTISQYSRSIPRLVITYYHRSIIVVVIFVRFRLIGSLWMKTLEVWKNLVKACSMTKNYSLISITLSLNVWIISED